MAVSFKRMQFVQTLDEENDGDDENVFINKTTNKFTLCLFTFFF